MTETKKEIAILSEDMIVNKIYEIRNQKVMLDFELAELYGYETKTFNQQVKNNIDKFDSDFMFRLSKEEWEILRSKNLTSSWGGTRYLPFAFNEQGIYMLMTVLKGELAIRQSKALIRTFKQMKDIIIENRDILGARELLQLSLQTSKNTKDIADMKANMATKDDFNKVWENFIDPETYKHFLLLNGKKLEADIAYTQIYKSAKHSIFVVDNYIGLKTLELLRGARDGVKITIFSDNVKNKDSLTLNLVNDFKSDYPSIDINFFSSNKNFHDRYIAIDYGMKKEAIYHCGASSKDAGNKVTTITKIEDVNLYLYHFMFDELLKNPKLKL